MSYTPISIREALDKLNARNNGWFLPQVQRQYVWGARDHSESYVCLLLDSLLKGYPIGGIVLWETEQRIPFREFIGDYAPDKHALQVEEGRWGAPKSLVYDGQQRLQTLYSVLHHRFNGRVLHYDLLFDADKFEADETGFFFADKDVFPKAHWVRMTELANTPCTQKEKVKFETRVLNGMNDEQGLLVRENFSTLWNVFVDTNHKSLAYFSVKSDTPNEVNEIFRRLNTGGIALTQNELLLSKIKAVVPDYEEGLWKLSKEIQNCSGGIAFSSADLLQFFNLLVKNTTKIDAERLDQNDIGKFVDHLNNDEAPLKEVFSSYLRDLFGINHASIIRRWLAILPLAAYFVTLKRNNHEWRIRALNEPDVRLIHQYFLLSQFCDWNTQTIVNASARLAMAAAENNESFPLDAIRNMAVKMNRIDELRETQLMSLPWLATKVVMPGRIYEFHEQKPQVDHIFPTALKGQDETYQTDVDVLWNFQPISAEVNNYKRNRHPKEFFNSEDGRKYWDSYDFIPNRDDVMWDSYKDFIACRRLQMLRIFEERYGLAVMPSLES